MLRHETLQADLAESAKGLPPILTLREAADFMRLSTRTLRRMIASGRLQTTKVKPTQQGKVLVPRRAVIRALSGKE